MNYFLVPNAISFIFEFSVIIQIIFPVLNDICWNDVFDSSTHSKELKTQYFCFKNLNFNFSRSPWNEFYFWVPFDKTHWDTSNYRNEFYEMKNNLFIRFNTSLYQIQNYDLYLFSDLLRMSFISDIISIKLIHMFQIKKNKMNK